MDVMCHMRRRSCASREHVMCHMRRRIHACTPARRYRMDTRRSQSACAVSLHLKMTVFVPLPSSTVGSRHVVSRGSIRPIACRFRFRFKFNGEMDPGEWSPRERNYAGGRHV